MASRGRTGATRGDASVRVSSLRRRGESGSVEAGSRGVPRGGRDGERGDGGDSLLPLATPEVYYKEAQGARKVAFEGDAETISYLPGSRLNVVFEDDPKWIHERLLLWPVGRESWVVKTPDGDVYEEGLEDYKRVYGLPLPGHAVRRSAGTVEFSRGWTKDELTDMVKEGRSLAKAARKERDIVGTSDPLVMVDFGGHALSVPGEGVVEKVTRRLRGKVAPPRPPALQTAHLWSISTPPG